MCRAGREPSACRNHGGRGFRLRDLLHCGDIDTKALDPIKDPISHQVLPYAPYGEAFQAHLGCGDDGRSGGPGNRERQLIDEVEQPPPGGISVNGHTRQSKVMNPIDE